MITRALATATLKPVILSILNDGDSYGYQIIQSIQSLSEGELQWTTGTLYPFLHGLENEGLVVSYWQEAENAPRRKYYQLTPKGRQAILEEQQQWVNVNRMLVKLWGPSPELAWS
jgi:DNA-binding PadR family transcriptional regulator